MMVTMTCGAVSLLHGACRLPARHSFGHCKVQHSLISLQNILTDKINVAQDREHWQALVNTEIKL